MILIGNKRNFGGEMRIFCFHHTHDKLNICIDFTSKPFISCHYHWAWITDCTTINENGTPVSINAYWRSTTEFGAEPRSPHHWRPWPSHETRRNGIGRGHCQTGKQIDIYLYIYIYVYVCLYVFIYEYIWVYIYIYMCVCVCVCVINRGIGVW